MLPVSVFPGTVALADGIANGVTLGDQGAGLVLAALLPLTAWMLVSQKNPYHALVIRGILGAVAALVYAFFGAADVALTEALVGTMLSITLYAIAVRSSMSMRLGVLADTPVSAALLSELRQVLKPYHLRLETVPYDSLAALTAALRAKEIHTVWAASPKSTAPALQTRLPRLLEILQPVSLTSVSLAETTAPSPSSHPQEHLP